MASPSDYNEHCTIARTLETTEAELMHSIFPHPTLSEMMHESTLAAFGRAIHI